MLARMLAFTISGWSRTLRFRLTDQCGLREGRITGPAIWAFWHNRMFVMPVVYHRLYRHRSGVVLTSPSRDGAIIAEVMLRFGVGSVRGSSSRRGSTALLELTSVVEKGEDIVFTPDGPRGPRYRLGPGIVLLAQKTGAPVVPINVEYSRCWRFGRWDGFMVPKPFARTEVTFGPLHYVPPTTTDEAFEAERVRLENVLQSMMRMR
jgi:lysophospholipid acyltransferase (LPLAT)-like uncharacterized protein